MPLAFLFFEGFVGCLFIACLRHAARRSGACVWRLVAGAVFGILLEWATIQQLEAYQYGRFALMLGPVPLVIGVAWGVIIYACQRFSDSTTLPSWARPVLDGVLALTIDLAMDAIAIRLGMWDWGQGFDAGYFGVPYANFWAWFWVVSSFSAGVRLLAGAPSWWSRWLGPLGAILLGVMGVLVTNAVIVFVVPPAWYRATIAATLLGAVVLVLSLRPSRHSHQAADALSLWVTGGFHLYFLVVGLLTGVILQPPVLLLISVVMMGVALVLHRAEITALCTGVTRSRERTGTGRADTR